MKRLLTALLASLTTTVIAAPPAANAVPSPKPNFVVIFIDDMGYGDIGSFGSMLNRTPQLDRMATEGMRFTSFYAAHAWEIHYSAAIGDLWLPVGYRLEEATPAVDYLHDAPWSAPPPAPRQ